MGLSLGGSMGGTDSKSQTTSSATATPTFSGDQTSLQAMLSSVFGSLLPAAGNGTLSAPVQAIETGNAAQINKTSGATGDAMNRFLSSRGFGASGQTGQVALQTELGRQAALGQNASNAGGQQLMQNNTALADALNFAFNTPGETKTGQAQGSGSSTNWGVGGGASIGFAPSAGAGG